MKCPVDEVHLLMTEREGIEIDYCPQCRGVWLDRGELDKLIERSVTELPEAPRGYDYRREEERRGYDHRRDEGYGRGRRKRGWLGDIFEMGD